MIRMICIKEGYWSDSRNICDKSGPSYLEEVFITKSIERESKIYYQIHNYIYDSQGVHQYFNSQWFIPCSDIDEVELVNEKELENI